MLLMAVLQNSLVLFLRNVGVEEAVAEGFGLGAFFCRRDGAGSFQGRNSPLGLTVILDHSRVIVIKPIFWVGKSCAGRCLETH